MPENIDIVIGDVVAWNGENDQIFAGKVLHFVDRHPFDSRKPCEVEVEPFLADPFDMPVTLRRDQLRLVPTILPGTPLTPDQAAWAEALALAMASLFAGEPE